MKCYLCRQTVVPRLEVDEENNVSRLICPCCESATDYKSDLEELKCDFREGNTYGGGALSGGQGKTIKQKVQETGRR